MTTPFHQTCQDIEAELYAPPRTVFPVQIELSGQTYSFAIWAGQQLTERFLAIDTETRPIEGREIPELALVSVYGPQSGGWFIHPTDLAAFLKQHSQAFWAAHNAVFDFQTICQALQAEPAAREIWWETAGDGRLYCSLLGDCLLRLAENDAEPIPRNLGVVAKEYCGLDIPKDDPFRLEYGRLIGRPKEAWPTEELGLWEYGGKDPVGHYLVAQEQIRQANQAIQPYRNELLPDAIRRFGPLSCTLQVQGAVALDFITRSGIGIDLKQTKQLQGAVAEIVQQHMKQLEELGGEEVFRKYGPKSKQTGYQVTPAGVARRNSKAIKHKLEKIARQHGLKPKKNKDGLVSDSAHYWKTHQDCDPFVAAYVQFREQAKLLEFFAKLDQPRIYPRYRPLVRTGRCACSTPNIQQLPRDSRFRELIIAPPGSLILQVDYSVLELRTLAQVCLKRFGKSVLADLFREGVDPHVHTARLLMDLTLEQFKALPKDEQKTARQKAKALNFGIPGGLGAKTLVAYAKYSYGVDLTIEEARAFRKRLVGEIYPELSAYLQNRSQKDIADNLQTTELMVSQAYRRPDQQLHASRIVAGAEETPDGEPYEQDLIDHVWLCLQQLNKNPALQRRIKAKEPSGLLMRQIFCGHAVTLSGRLRGHIGFTQRSNTPFSGLAADGAKLAMFRLLRAGFWLCGFIHDEVLILLPEGSDYTASVAQVRQIMADAMNEVVPDLPIQTEFLLADRWFKDAEQLTSPTGRIIPYKRKPEVPTFDLGQQKRAAKHQKENEGATAIPF